MQVEQALAAEQRMAYQQSKVYLFGAVVGLVGCRSFVNALQMYTQKDLTTRNICLWLICLRPHITERKMKGEKKMYNALYIIGCLTVLVVVVRLLHQLYKLIADEEFCKDAGIVIDPCEKCSGDKSECEKCQHSHQNV